MWQLLAAIVAVITVGAGLAEMTGYSLRDFLSQPGELTILYDETRHLYSASNGEWARISVRNVGRATVNNVVLSITSIAADKEEMNDELQQFVGLKLCQSQNPLGEYRNPEQNDGAGNPPKSSVMLHPGQEETFDFLRLRKLPLDYVILHCNYIRVHQNTPFEGFQRRPHGVIPPGKYKVTLSAQGDDLEAQEKQFEFWSSSNSVTFRLVENVF